jgi:hypothetical protein
VIFLEQYNLKFRFVQEEDASFLVQLRTDPIKAKYISTTDTDIEKQRLWIREYKIREKSKSEFYFIVTDEENVEFATYRLYNRTEDTIEIGSFISIPAYSNPINIVKVDIIMKSYVFDILGYNSLNFEVRKENKAVILYQRKFRPKLFKEDNENYYFMLDRAAFGENKYKFVKFFL